MRRQRQKGRLLPILTAFLWRAPSAGIGCTLLLLSLALLGLHSCSKHCRLLIIPTVLFIFSSRSTQMGSAVLYQHQFFSKLDKITVNNKNVYDAHARITMSSSYDNGPISLRNIHCRSHALTNPRMTLVQANAGASLVHGEQNEMQPKLEVGGYNLTAHEWLHQSSKHHSEVCDAVFPTVSTSEDDVSRTVRRNRVATQQVAHDESSTASVVHVFLFVGDFGQIPQHWISANAAMAQPPHQSTGTGANVSLDADGSILHTLRHHPDDSTVRSIEVKSYAVSEHGRQEQRRNERLTQGRTGSNGRVQLPRVHIIRNDVLPTTSFSDVIHQDETISPLHVFERQLAHHLQETLGREAPILLLSVGGKDGNPSNFNSLVERYEQVDGRTRVVSTSRCNIVSQHEAVGVDDGTATATTTSVDPAVRSSSTDTSGKNQKDGTGGTHATMVDCQDERSQRKNDARHITHVLNYLSSTRSAETAPQHQQRRDDDARPPRQKLKIAGVFFSAGSMQGEQHGKTPADKRRFDMYLSRYINRLRHDLDAPHAPVIISRHANKISLRRMLYPQPKRSHRGPDRSPAESTTGQLHAGILSDGSHLRSSNPQRQIEQSDRRSAEHVARDGRWRSIRFSGIGRSNVPQSRGDESERIDSKRSRRDVQDAWIIGNSLGSMMSKLLVTMASSSVTLGSSAAAMKEDLEAVMDESR